MRPRKGGTRPPHMQYLHKRTSPSALRTARAAQPRERNEDTTMNQTSDVSTAERTTRSLWRYTIKSAGQLPQAGNEEGHNTWPLLAFYHLARRQIEAHPQHASAITREARKQMQHAVRELTKQAATPDVQEPLPFPAAPRQAV